MSTTVSPRPITEHELEQVERASISERENREIETQARSCSRTLHRHASPAGTAEIRRYADWAVELTPQRLPRRA